MPRHVAIQPGKLYPQPNYSLEVDREGEWTATQVFLCHRNSITKLMPRPGTPHPEIPFISVDNAAAQVSEGDLAEINCNYAGTDNADADPAKTTYSLGLSLSVKEHATLSAGAHVDHGVDIETPEKHVNRAADRGCCVSTFGCLFSCSKQRWRVFI